MCPACGADGASILRSMDHGPFLHRRRECPCGAEWTTTETYLKGTLKVQDKAAIRSNPAQETWNPVQESGKGEQKTGDNVISDSDLNSDPVRDSSGPSKLSDLTRSDRARVRAAQTRLIYPPEFQSFWSGLTTNRRLGMKSDALKAWIKAGRPDCALMSAAWIRYLNSLGDTFAKDVSTWINARGWLEEYGAAPKAPGVPRERPAPYHAPAKPPAWAAKAVDSAAELERFKREAAGLADQKAVG